MAVVITKTVPSFRDVAARMVRSCVSVMWRGPWERLPCPFLAVEEEAPADGAAAPLPLVVVWAARDDVILE